MSMPCITLPVLVTLLVGMFLSRPAAAAELSAAVPGVVIAHSPSASGLYVGSPSLAVLPDGDYVATHDDFGPKSPLSRTFVFASLDKGKTWTPRATIQGQYWSTLFVHRGALYLIGTTREYGFAAIRRSDDGGRTWTAPTDADHGLLHADGKYHCAPVPVVEHDGRVWRAMEDAMGPGGWGSHFRSFMLSAPADSDLLRASNWTSSTPLGRDASWNNHDFGGWLEGNAVVAPDGRGMVNVLRVATANGAGKAAIVCVSADGKTETFDSAHDLIDLPGGSTKFTIRRDPQTSLYWSLTNYVPPTYLEREAGAIRNTLALISSPDLRAWKVRSILLQHPEVAHHGFQYVDWLFEGEDIIFVSRTAYDDGPGTGAHSYHDANYLTFHRLPHFRERTMHDAPLQKESIHDGSAPSTAP